MCGLRSGVNTMNTTPLLSRVTLFLYLLSAGMFVMTVIELIALRHTDGTQMIPFYLCGIGVLALIATWLQPRGIVKKASLVILAAITLGGLFGMWQHIEANNEGDEEEARAAQLMTDRDDDGQEADTPTLGSEDAIASGSTWDRVFHGQAPILAPLSISAASITGIAAAAVREATINERIQH